MAAPGDYEEALRASMTSADVAAEEDYMAKMAEEANIQLAREGVLPSEQLSERELRLGEEAMAQDAAARAPEPVEDLGPIGRAASYQQRLAEEIGIGDAGAGGGEVPGPTAPGGPSPWSLQGTMGQAAGLFTRTPSRIVETPAKEILETEKEEILDAAALERAAELKSAEVAAAGMKRTADIEQETHDRLQDMQVDEAANEFERKQYVEQEKSKLDGAIDRYRTGQIKDPWGDRSTATKVKDGIALALGALGQAFLGGENVAMSVINTALDTEMESARANMNIAGTAVGMRENALQESMRISGDARIAELHARQSMLEAIKYKLRSEAQATGSQQVMANAEKTVAQMDQQIAGLKAQMDLGIQQNGFAKVGGGYAVPKEQRQFATKLLEAGFKEGIGTAGKLQLEQAKGMSAGERGGLKPNEFANQLTKYGDRRKDADDAKGDVERFMAQYSTGDIPGYKAFLLDPRTAASGLSQAARDVKQAVGGMIASYVKSISGGTVAPAEYERLRKVVEGEGTIDDLRNGMRLMEIKIDRQIDLVNRSTQPEIVKAYRRSPNLPESPGQGTMEAKYTELER